MPGRAWRVIEGVSITAHGCNAFVRVSIASKGREHAMKLLGIVRRYVPAWERIRRERQLQSLAREAVEWRDRLLTEKPAENERFAEWITQSADHVQVWLELTAFDVEIARLVGPAVVLEDTEWSTTPTYRKLHWAMACGLAGIVLITGALGFGLWYRGDAQYFVTRTGEHQSMVLADGSTVELNSRSRVVIRFTHDRRLVDLLEGEAFFNVAPNAERVFEVTARDITSRVLGTKFSMRVADESVETLVSEGRVQVSRQDRALGFPAGTHPLGSPLSGGEKIVVARADSMRSTVAGHEVERQLQWTRGKISFTGERLGDVVQELNRYTTHPLTITDDSISDVRVGGAYAVESADAYGQNLVKYFGRGKISRR
jgi:transmembrane sensor